MYPSQPCLASQTLPRMLGESNVNTLVIVPMESPSVTTILALECVDAAGLHLTAVSEIQSEVSHAVCPIRIFGDASYDAIFFPVTVTVWVRVGAPFVRCSDDIVG